jgi:hypothetical protein
MDWVRFVKTGGRSYRLYLALLASLCCRLPAEVRFTKRSQHVGLSPKSMRSAEPNTVGSTDAVVRAPFLWGGLAPLLKADSYPSAILVDELDTAIRSLQLPAH